MKHRFSLLVFASMLLLVLLTACGATGTADGGEIRYIEYKVYDPVYVGIDQGFFADHGVEVTLAGDVLAGAPAIQVIASGNAEAGLTAVPSAINANAAGLPVQFVSDHQTSMNVQHLQTWYVRENSPIESVEDLCDPAVRDALGRKPVYGINNTRASFHYTTLMMLDRMGLDEDCVDFQLLGFTDQIAALEEGSADVIGVIEPYQTYVRTEYGDSTRELWNDFDFYGERHVALIFVNRIWAENNTADAEAFVAGLTDAMAFVEANPDASRAIISEYTGIPEDAVPDYHYTEGGLLDMSDITFWLDYLRERGDLTNDRVTAEQVATNAYNPNR